MTFVELFGSIEKLAVLDFLGDHPNYAYSLAEIKENQTSLLLEIYGLEVVVDELMEAGLIKIVDTKYQLDTENPIVRAVLKHDFEEGKKIADKLAKDGK